MFSMNLFDTHFPLLFIFLVPVIRKNVSFRKNSNIVISRFPWTVG